jgi:UDP-N-acetylmuramoylalanine--D-glutamate ligase
MEGLRPPLPHGPWLVVGLARSGLAAGALLRARGETVVGVDARHPEVGEPGFPVHLGTDGLEELSHARAVVKSPGVPPRAPVIAAAREQGIPVLGELELAWRLLEQPFIAVTGTNGKTTTARWIGHAHEVAGLPAAVAGNVGTPLSSLAAAGSGLAPDAVVVCEASSYQLYDTLLFAPDAAVLLNLGSDHLDWHGDVAAYRAAKLQVFARQGNDAVAVAPAGLGVEDLGGCARRVLFGREPAAELSLRSGQLFWAEEPLLRADELALPGAHNADNAMATAAVCLARGMDPDAVREALRTFPGVEHRLEDLGLHDGVRWVNDSKATNVESTLVALAATAPPIRLILGGDDAKGEDFAPLRAPVAERAASVELIGQAAGRLREALGTGTERGDLEHAVAAARAVAQPGDVVLLSPACASFDQFTDFEARGRRFKELVAARRM